MAAALQRTVDLLPSGEPREFQFTDRDFDLIKTLIYEHAGIHLTAAKREMVYSRLARRLRAIGKSSFKDYLAVLKPGEQGEWQHFVNSLTTNLTSFFREEHHFPVLADLLGKLPPPHTIWCAAASTGEEPYSLAMTAVDVFGRFDPPVRIIASDIDTNVLDYARNGVYTMDKLAKLPNDRLKRFFLRGSGAREGYARVRPELQALVSFKRVNLLDAAWPVDAPLSAIFCRNVMIYFDKVTQRRILQRCAPLLRPGGLFFAGHSENFAQLGTPLRLRGRTVYEVA